MTTLDLDTAIAALADRTRRGVVDRLRERPRRAGDLAAMFELSPPAMSRHLRLLRRGGLIEEERIEEDARVRVYRLRREAFDALGDWLKQIESYWTEQLDSFSALANAKAAGSKNAGSKKTQRRQPR